MSFFKPNATAAEWKRKRRRRRKKNEEEEEEMEEQSETFLEQTGSNDNQIEVFKTKSFSTEKSNQQNMEYGNSECLENYIYKLVQGN